MDYSFVKIPTIGLWYYRHDFINGGHKWPICGTTISNYTVGTSTTITTDTGLLNSIYSTNTTANNNFYGTITISPNPLNEIWLSKVNRKFS